MSSLRGPIVPLSRSKAIDRSNARLPFAWECLAGSTGRLDLGGPWMDPSSAQAIDLVRRAVGDASQPSMFVLPDTGPSALTRAMLDAAAGDRRVYVLGPLGFGAGQRDPGLRERASSFVLVRRTSIPLLPAVVNFATRRVVLCGGAIHSGAPQWLVALDDAQSAAFVRVALHWFWHHAVDEGWTEPKSQALTFQAPQDRPGDFVPPTDGPVRLLRRPVDSVAVPDAAVFVRNGGAGLPRQARRLVTRASGDGQAALAEIVAAGSEVVSLGVQLPEMWATPSEGVIEWPIADFLLRLSLNPSQARPLHDALLRAKPAAVLRRDAKLGELAGAVWLPGAVEATPCVEEEVIEVGDVSCQTLDEVSSKEPAEWPDAPALARKAVFSWTSLPPTPASKAVRSGLYQQWHDAKNSVTSRIKSCGELLKSAGERSDQAKTRLGRWFEGALGLDRRRGELIAEHASLERIEFLGRSVENAHDAIRRLDALETAIQEYVGGVDGDIATADERQQREQWEREQDGHKQRLGEIDAKIAAAKERKAALEGALRGGQATREAEPDREAYERKLSDDLKSVSNEIARLNGSRSEPEQALKRSFTVGRKQSTGSSSKSGRGHVPPPVKEPPGRQIPMEALPSIGELLEAGSDRFLAIEDWSQLEAARAEAARLKARLVARRR